VLGAIAALAFLTHAALSFSLVRVLAELGGNAEMVRFYADDYATFPAFLNEAIRLLEKQFAGRTAAFAAYTVPLLIATVVFVALLIVLHRGRRYLDDRAASLLLKWSVVFALAASPSVPMLMQDFWLSAAWGNMVATGHNPYHEDIRAVDRDKLPLDKAEYRNHEHMTYGPAWALASGTIMRIADGNSFVAGLLFKLVLVGSWILSLFLVHRLTRGLGPYGCCLAVATFGWIPLSVVYIVIEGHNDILMIVFMLLWLRHLSLGRAFSVATLAGSTLFKYTSFSMIVVDAICHLRLFRTPFRRYAGFTLLGALLGVSALALFFRSTDFFQGLSNMQGWRILSPRDAVRALAPGFDSSLGRMVKVGFVLLAVWQVWQLWKTPDRTNGLRAAIAIMGAILFGISGIIWPWYLLWPLALGACLPAWGYTRWLVGLALAMPLLLAFRAVGIPASDWLRLGVAPVYVFSLLWLFCSRWFYASPDAEGRATPEWQAR
jgi:hypothetical protein